MKITDPSLNDLTWAAWPWEGQQAHSDTKLHDVLLTFAVARRWPDALSNALEPGWVPTKMGGPGATDDMDPAHRTQVWIAVSDDPAASVSGEYFYHMQSGVRSPPHATSVPRIACWIFVLAQRAWNFHPDFTVPPTTSQLRTIVSVFLCNGICFWLQTSRHPIERRLR